MNMNLPPFEDFLATLTPDRLNAIYTGIEWNEVIQISDVHDMGNISAVVNHLAAAIVARSSVVNLNLLREYHEWLRGQSW